MRRFLLSFLFFLSCGFNSGCTEIFTQKKFPFNKTSNSARSVSDIECTSHEECQTFILESKCLDEKCKCEDDKVLSSDASRCLTKAKEFGSPCEEDIQCSSLLSTGGVCDVKRRSCSCKMGFHYLNGACWKNVGLNEKCVKREQCFSSYEYVGFECKEKVCKCRDKYYERLGSGCRRIRKSGDFCNLDDDCERPNTCENMKCTRKNSNEENINYFSNITIREIWKKNTPLGLNCTKGMFEFNGKCARELGMNCNDDSECKHIKSAVCLDNLMCACQPPLFVASENNKECLKVAKGKVLDIKLTSCQTDSQCGVFGPNSYCSNNRCSCKDGTYFETEKQFCWNIKPLQGDCNDNKDCFPSVTHAECKDLDPSRKKCICKNGYHQRGSKCVLDALEVGKPCEVDDDCRFANSFCNTNKVCVCNQNYYPDGGKCKPGIGTPCVTDNDCVHLKNTECKTGSIPVKQCLCKENHTNSDDYKYCLPVAKYKERCTESFQCKFYLGNFGECKNEICNCREGAHYSYEKCHKSKFVGEPCSKLQDCFPGNDTNSIICQKGFCQCNYGYVLDKTKACVKTNSAIITTSIKSHSMLLTSLLLYLIIR